jgi:phage gpG-like protein
MTKTTVEKQWHGSEIKIQGKKVISDSIFEIGLVVEGQAKLLAAKKSGYMAASINTQASNGDGTEPESPTKYGDGTIQDGAGPLTKIEVPRESNNVYVGTNVEYAPHVEFGTVRSYAQPFLRPSLALAQGKTLTIVKVNSKMQFKEYLK